MEKIFNVESADDSTGFLLWQVTNLWQREIKKALEQYDLTHSQFVLLASILWFQKQEKEATQIALSARTKIDPMTTSTVLRTLQSKNLLKRQEHATDTRAKTVELTDTGREMTIQAVKLVEKFDFEFFKTLKPEISDFNKKLKALLE